ncbi:hypothetical protein PpBr36_06818 [Pyricularia pennisetigena]|uniref:hypothetical protein n=1 Tax=Pyricularia pennisetigena TaxID=1578925 RepID=UPI00114F87C3|nr:hypothetical protein PpBr36_06818 [Pyricularia pennisetigena]TLS25002.1 hypothetical protein PpBr36_06818 [Pyricularia pennisetigena]
MEGDQVSIIDWDMAGYCPLEWIRTKFAICGVMVAERVVGNEVDGSLSVERNHEYREMIEQKLGDMGFPEVTKAYIKMENMREKEWKKRRPWLQQLLASD